MDIKEFFDKHPNVAVAFSGGVDSAVLLLLAVKYANKVKAYFVKSQFQPAFEQSDAEDVVKRLGCDFEIINVNVLSDGNIFSNTKERCYFCKKRIFKTICDKARGDGFDTVTDGTNADDDISDRPGYKALGEFGVLSPLKICSYTKAQIRSIAKENGLAVYNKPSYSCLATRIPFGTKINEDLLAKTENAEGELMKLGFTNFRVRYFNGGAKLELCRKDKILYQTVKDEVDSLLLKSYSSVLLTKERADE